MRFTSHLFYFVSINRKAPNPDYATQAYDLDFTTTGQTSWNGTACSGMSYTLDAGRLKFNPGNACTMTGYKDFAVTSGKLYTISVDIDRTGIANFNVEIYTAATLGGTGTLVTTITNPANGTVNYTFTPGQNFVRVLFRKNSTEHTSFYIDNLRIQTMASPYMAMVVMTSDYYPFGYQMPGRHVDDNKYRYGYNGMEKDAEMHGEGNSYTTEFRQYNPRLGRWLSLDPLMGKFPWMSPYVGFDNNPIKFVDPNGLEVKDWIAKATKDENGVTHNKWEWVPESYGSKEEALASGNGYVDWKGKGGFVDEMHMSDGYVGPVTLMDGGNYEKGFSGQIEEVQVTASRISQSQIDATFNPEKNYITGSIQEALAQQISNQTQSHLDKMKRGWALDNLFNGLDNLTLGMFAAGASPLVIGGSVAYSPLALSSLSTEASYMWGALKTYHTAIGIGSGGYVSLMGEFVNQSFTQYSSNGRVEWKKMDIVAGINSLFPQSSFGGKLCQGLTPTFVSFTTEKGWDGSIVKKKNATWIQGSILNGTFGTLLDKQPLINGFGGDMLNKSFGGTIQGTVDGQQPD